ncbi:D-glycero-D-manno-heptose 1-phosphate guanosyltransferase [Spirochaetia bacterium]|nr:D-glycero-D-manno-heptose 1-phosphate guanosyltransferase [Spirochaetia bacterium]
MLPVIILAGGLATRMRPVTETIPKAMIDVNGKPFIHHQMMLLQKNNVRHTILCLGYLGEQIQNYIKDGGGYGIKVEYSFDGDKLLGTGGAIKKIGRILPETFFILYGDSYLDIDYQNVEDAFISSNKKGLMTVFKNDDNFDTSNVIFKNNQIVTYNKKQKSRDMNYIDYGLGILHRSVFDSFPANKPFDLAEIYEQLSGEKQLAGYEVFERFYEIGSPAGLEDLRKKLIV